MANEEPFRAQYPTLVEGIDSVPEILDHLYSKRVLSYAIVGRIRDIRNHGDQVRQLLDHLMRRPEQDIRTFADILHRTENGHLVELLGPTYGTHCTEEGCDEDEDEENSHLSSDSECGCATTPGVLARERSFTIPDFAEVDVRAQCRNYNQMRIHRNPVNPPTADRDQLLHTMLYPRSCTYAYHAHHQILIFIEDWGNHRVLVCDERGNGADVFYRVRWPVDVAIMDADESVVVLSSPPWQTERSSVHILSSFGDLLRIIESINQGEMLGSCSSVVSFQNQIAVLTQDYGVLIFRKNGRLLRQFDDVYGLAMTIDSENGALYITDEFDSAVNVYSWDGDLFESFGIEIMDSALSWGVCVDSAGLVYVSRLTEDRVDIYDLNREIVGWLGGENGSEPGEMNSPRGVAMLPDGRLMVVDGGNHRLQLFRNQWY